MLVLLPVWSEMQIVCIWSSWCHCIPKPLSFLASFKSRLVLPYWYCRTQVVLEKRQLTGCNSSSTYFYCITPSLAGSPWESEVALTLKCRLEMSNGLSVASPVVHEEQMRQVISSFRWHCWSGDRKSIEPWRNLYYLSSSVFFWSKWSGGCWHGYLFAARCRLAYGPADATATHCLLLQ